MMARFRMLFLLAGLSTFSAASAALAPPAVLAPFIHDGSFVPGDYGFVRGAFWYSTQMLIRFFRSWRFVSLSRLHGRVSFRNRNMRY
ncbi:hypothetical protein [Gluconobacter aidae]|uniref:Uncharacterized protein n=1 Tax=Gluconobacter aidae TaxID=2662454 RepID=A0A7X1SRL5_9PROT|nr:hypothetical protein [Gluconobacter aidae]MQR98670.1 hypothetical protein [Gluconobacter aidae]